MLDISIVIPTYNRLDRLKTVTAGLERQTYPLDRFEVIIVSDGSSDGTDEFLRSYKHPLNLKALFQKNQGPAAARNLGVSQATGEFILFIDDDVVPTPELVGKHLKTHKKYDRDRVVLGPMLTPQDAVLSPWTLWEQEMLMKQYRSMTSGKWQPTARQFYTGNSSLKRQHLIDSGGFDISFRRAEDVELAYRLAVSGVRFEYNPEAIGHHYPERDYESWIKIAYDYGMNDVIFSQIKGHHWLLPTVLKELKTRNTWIRALIRLCLDRDAFRRMVSKLCKRVAVASHCISCVPLTIKACSAIFNLSYYQGVSDHLGGRVNFFEAVSKRDEL